MVHLALLMMLKNEKLRIEVSLNSVLGIVDSVVIFDTGSTDGTQDIVRDWCKKHNLPLYLKEEPFVNFCVSRNTSLDFLDTTSADYALLLDCNDELQDKDGIKKFVTEYKGECSAFHVCQVWWNGHSNDKYYNVRLVKVRGNGTPDSKWRYKGRVHEYMSCRGVEKFNEEMTILQSQGKPILENKWITRVEANWFILFQDRTKDDDKSLKRFARDKVLLYEDYLEGVDYIRTLFYLAQTLTCLNENQEAYHFYRLRLKETGFTEEVYHAYYRCGQIAQLLKHNEEEYKLWYLKAIYYSNKTFINPRVEALVKLAEIYLDEENWKLSYEFLKVCICIPYPEELILFVDRRTYDYTRYHLMGRVAYYAGDNEQGLKSCLDAILFLISFGQEYETDKNNLKWYVDEKSLEILYKYIEDVKSKATPSETRTRDDIIKLVNVNKNKEFIPKDNIVIEKKDYEYHRDKTFNSVEPVELYNHYLMCAKLCKDDDEKIVWNLKATELSCKLFGQSSMDAHINMATFFADKKEWKNAMIYVKFSCETNMNVAFDKKLYDYDRWHLLGRVGYYTGNQEWGRNGCINAIIHGDNKIDVHNLQFYAKNDKLRIELVKHCKNKDLKNIIETLKNPELNKENKYNLETIFEKEEVIKEKTPSEKLREKLKKKLDERMGKN